jgi:hypothetical protein
MDVTYDDLRARTMQNHIALLLFCLVLACSSGCSLVSSIRGLASQTVESLRPTSFDSWDPGSETGDPWVQQAGAEARGHRPVEKEFDPLGFRQVFMSDRARDIERNLGIE